MVEGSISSSSSSKCAVCGKKTGNYKLYEQTNIEIRIPACNEGGMEKVDVRNYADLAIKMIKESIK